MPEVQNTVTEVKNACDGLFSKLDTAKERTSKLKNRSVETSQAEMQRIKMAKRKREERPRTLG